MERYKLANIKKYLEVNERIKFITHSSKISAVESIRQRCRYLASSNERVLDIGGGSGAWTQILKEEGVPVDVYALDLSLYALNEERQEVICICGDMANLPFKDESFDRAFFFA